MHLTVLILLLSGQLCFSASFVHDIYIYFLSTNKLKILILKKDLFILKRGRERESQVNSVLSVEPDVRLDLMTLRST